MCVKKLMIHRNVKERYHDDPRYYAQYKPTARVKRCNK